MRSRYLSGGSLHLLSLIVLAIASLFFTLNLAHAAKRIKAASQSRRNPPRPIDSYSYVGDDFPIRLPVEERLVKMTVEDSVHFSLKDYGAAEEWLWTASVGDGHIRLGADKRMFAVAMFHQLHCLRGIRSEMEKDWSTLHPARKEHIHHCFNYLRQWTLCSADVTLEPGDFTKRNYTTERVGATHTCLDWEPAYEMMRVKWNEWIDFRIEHNIPYREDTG